MGWWRNTGKIGRTMAFPSTPGIVKRDMEARKVLVEEFTFQMHPNPANRWSIGRV